VLGTLSVDAVLRKQVVLEVGQLNVPTSGLVSIGSESSPFTNSEGGFELRLNASLVDQCHAHDERPSVDVHGSFLMYGDAAETPALVDASVQDNSTIVAANSIGALVKGQRLGVWSEAGQEVAVIAAVDASGRVTLAGPLIHAHTARASVAVLSHSARITSAGAPALLRLWNGIEGATPAQLSASSKRDAGGLVFPGVPRASASCAGGRCGAFVTAPRGVRRQAFNSFALHGVEVQGLGEPGEAAVHFRDFSCAARWPSSAKSVRIAGSAFHRLVGAGFTLEGCLADFEVRRRVQSLMDTSPAHCIVERAIVTAATLHQHPVHPAQSLRA
jgi:hypothetical protein